MSVGRKMLSLLGLAFLITAFSAFALGQQADASKQESDRSATEGQKRDRGRFDRSGRSGFRDGRGHRRHHRGGMIRGLRKLELSDGQNAQIKTIIETHRTGQRPYRDEMKALAMKFRAGTGTEDDRVRMEELKSQSRAASDQLRDSILGVLTPDQLQRLEQMKAERKQRMEERRRRWMERRQQPKSDSPETETDN